MNTNYQNFRVLLFIFKFTSTRILILQYLLTLFNFTRTRKLVLRVVVRVQDIPMNILANYHILFKLKFKMLINLKLENRVFLWLRVLVCTRARNTIHKNVVYRVYRYRDDPKNSIHDTYTIILGLQFSIVQQNFINFSHNFCKIFSNFLKFL